MTPRNIQSLLCAASLALTTATAQIVVDSVKYPDYALPVEPDAATAAMLAPKAEAATARPDHVNNAETPYFPPVFNQDGGSCGSASRIGYMLTYELNALRGLDGSLEENQYPTHFTWLLTNSNSGKEGMAKANGVPTVPVYGGRTYSALFGNQDTASPDFGWMQGYDKWYSAMFNRIERNANFPLSVETEEGREAVKQWLWNHSGDADFQAGGICGIGVASGGTWLRIPQTEANDAAGVTGMYYVGEWGAQVDHALTIVGYDDRIEFDLDGNGVYGETDKDEVGAWIVVNSWGDGWCNGGFIYCPYAKAYDSSGNKGYYKPEIYMVRKDYRPLRTFKITMDYSKRSELRIGGGISADLTADEPERSTYFEHFKFAGDGDGDGVDAETPMLGRWADGMHSEPMEFGYDMTDLSAAFDTRRPLKYFLVIESKSGATGTGTVSGLSVLDYEFDTEGIEFPADLGAEGVSIKNAGNRTIISVVVPGEAFNAPRNLTRTGTTLAWTAPAASPYTLTGYRLYAAGQAQTDLAADELTATISDTRADYQVSALYDYGGTTVESGLTDAASGDYCGTTPMTNDVYEFTRSGFVVENVFAESQEQVTIEYWLKPSSLISWNQHVGPAWNTFMAHTTAAGEVVAGWDTNNRVTTAAGSLRVGEWTHVAYVVDGTQFSVYLDGELAGTFTGGGYNGLPAMGDLVVGRNNESAGICAAMDELRIWSTARTQQQIQQYMYSQIADPASMPDLLAEVTMTTDAEGALVDATGRHAVTLYGGTNAASTDAAPMTDERPLTAAISLPAEGFFVGTPVRLADASSLTAVGWTWTATGSDIADGVAVQHPTVTFAEAGKQTITLIVRDAQGREATTQQQVDVAASPEPRAAFTLSTDTVPVGQRVSFINTSTAPTSSSFAWQMPGADVESSSLRNAAASYATLGTYTVMLTLTTADGQTSTATRDVVVVNAAPVAAFTVSPAVVLKGETVTFTDESQYFPVAWRWEAKSSRMKVGAYERQFQYAFARPGRYDVALRVSNTASADRLTRQGALVVCNADAETGLNFTGAGEQVSFDNLITDATAGFTIDWWMYAKAYGTSVNGIGADGLLITTGSSGTMSVALGGTTVTTPSQFVTLAEWHHYAVSYDGETLSVYKDGVLFKSAAVGPAASRCPPR